MEQWRDIQGYEGYYQISSLGRIKGLERKVYKKLYGNERTVKERIMTTEISWNGYERVRLNKEKISKKYLVHRLVCSAFLQNPNGLPQVNHKNGIKTDNNISNLEWCTRSYNIQHSFDKLNRKVNNKPNGRTREWHKLNNLKMPNSKPVLLMDKNNNILGEYDSITDLSNEINLSGGHISFCISGRRNNRKYNFKFK